MWKKHEKLITFSKERAIYGADHSRSKIASNYLGPKFSTHYQKNNTNFGIENGNNMPSGTWNSIYFWKSENWKIPFFPRLNHFQEVQMWADRNIFYNCAVSHYLIFFRPFQTKKSGSFFFEIPWNKNTVLLWKLILWAIKLFEVQFGNHLTILEALGKKKKKSRNLRQNIRCRVLPDFFLHRFFFSPVLTFLLALCLFLEGTFFFFKW